MDWGYLRAMRKRVALLAFVMVAGCGGPKEAATPTVYAPPPPVVDAWVLGTRDVRAEEPALLWNGLIGVRINRDGSGVENGFFAIDEYDTQGEEKIRALPNPLGNGTQGLVDVNRPYDQSLDMRSGVLTTRFTRVDGVQATYEHVLHPTKRMIAERVMFVGGDKSVVVGIPTAGKEPISSFRTASLQTLNDAPLKAGTNAVEVPARGKVVVERVITFGRSGNYWNIRDSRHGGKAMIYPEQEVPPKPTDYNDVYQAALEIWRKRWLTDIEIDGPVEDQQAIRSFLFYLRSAIHPDGEMSVSPFGLSDTMYGGHVFWDADLWVFPALALVDPVAAREIAEYRIQTKYGANSNYVLWGTNGRPTGQASLGKVDVINSKGIKYAWESSASGRETVPGPSKFEDHITGTVHHSLVMADMLGLIDPAEVKDITQRSSEFYLRRIEERPDGTFDLKGTMSPDENHVGDNDLFTNLVAQSVIDHALSKVPQEKRPRLYLPEDKEGFLTYDDDRFRGYKQAAAVLSIYPLQYPPAEKQARQMMERFSDKVIKNGPAMTDSVHSVIWSRLGEKEKAYAAWKASWEPFTRHPLMLFSEKRMRSKTYFTTGAGGALQSVLYGFAGMRLDWRQEPGSAWSTRLRGENWLSIKPNLPPSWKSLKFRNFSVNGRRYTLNVSPNAVQVVPGG